MTTYSIDIEVPQDSEKGSLGLLASLVNFFPLNHTNFKEIPEVKFSSMCYHGGVHTLHIQSENHEMVAATLRLGMMGLGLFTHEAKVILEAFDALKDSKEEHAKLSLCTPKQYQAHGMYMYGLDVYGTNDDRKAKKKRKHLSAKPETEKLELGISTLGSLTNVENSCIFICYSDDHTNTRSFIESNSQILVSDKCMADVLLKGTDEEARIRETLSERVNNKIEDSGMMPDWWDYLGADIDVASEQRKGKFKLTSFGMHKGNM